MYVSPMSLTMAFEFTGRALTNVKDASSLIKGMNGLLEMRTTALMKEADYQAYDDGTAARAVIKSISGATLTLQARQHGAAFDVRVNQGWCSPSSK
jgi:hypothetical protein